jgi:hypothetical protein
MNFEDIMPATYRSTGVERFRGNPFIEALPPLGKNRTAFLTGLSNYPHAPTARTRKSSSIVRMMELSGLNDVVFPFPEYEKAALAMATIMRESYISRNPLDVLDKQRRYALIHNSEDGAIYPFDWKSSAKGHFMLAVSGMGKTTFANAFLLRYPQVIRHNGYNGQYLNCHQIVYLVLRIPHDGTLKSLCLQFFQEIDDLLNTDYVRQAIGLRNIAPMVQLMRKVATSVSLGFLVIDEVQNLRNARSGDAEFVLNLFSEIIEKLGISLLAIATPAVQSVFAGSVRNARKIASYGETVLKPMKKTDPVWRNFCETYWDYTYVKSKGPLTQEVMDAWHKVSAGNTAFAALAFMLAQRNEIEGREVIDEIAFQRTAATDMAFLQPAIAALNSGKPAKLRLFDDLLFSPQYRDLRKAMGAADLEPGIANQQAELAEFEDIPIAKDDTIERPQKPRKSRSKDDSFAGVQLPTEDPLGRK